MLQESSLDFGQGVRLALGPQRGIEVDHKLAADPVVDGPEAGHDRGRTGGQKRLVEPDPFVAVGHVGGQASAEGRLAGTERHEIGIEVETADLFDAQDIPPVQLEMRVPGRPGKEPAVGSKMQNVIGPDALFQLGLRSIGADEDEAFIG